MSTEDAKFLSKIEDVREREMFAEHFRRLDDIKKSMTRTEILFPKD